ncbi:hypothetical protein V6N11_049180 [Hibiscus sabdariffa]
MANRSIANGCDNAKLTVGSRFNVLVGLENNEPPLVKRVGKMLTEDRPQEESIMIINACNVPLIATKVQVNEQIMESSAEDCSVVVESTGGLQNVNGKALIVLVDDPVRMVALDKVVVAPTKLKLDKHCNTGG